MIERNGKLIHDIDKFVADECQENLLDPKMFAEVLQDLGSLPDDKLRNLGKLMYNNNTEGAYHLFYAYFMEQMDASTRHYLGLPRVTQEDALNNAADNARTVL